MRHATGDQSRDIRWTPDLDFADDIALLPHTPSLSQEKTSRLSTYVHQVGLNVNTSNPQQVKVNREDLPMTEQFAYLGGIVRQGGGVGLDTQDRLNEARNTFKMLNSVWQSSQYIPKLKIYQSFVLSTFWMGQNADE